MYIFQISFLFFFEYSFPPAPPNENPSTLKELKDLLLLDCSACLNVASQSVFSKHPLRKKQSVDQFTKGPKQPQLVALRTTEQRLHTEVSLNRQRPCIISQTETNISASWIFNSVLIVITQNLWSQWIVQVKAMQSALLHVSAPNSLPCLETKPGVLLWLRLNPCL